MNPALRRSSAHVFVDNVLAPVLDDGDEHHLRRVLRLREGEQVSASDGRGVWRLCEFGPSAALLPRGDTSHEPRPTPSLTVGFSIPKGDRPEWIVQKLTELGVDRIVLIQADRSVVRWDDERARKNLARLAKVMSEAAMQSRRVWLPTLEGPVELSAFEGDDVAMAEPGGDELNLMTPTVLIGPEGGWSDAELGRIARHVAVGKPILRVETAALAAAVRLVALRDQLAT